MMFLCLCPGKYLLISKVFFAMLQKVTYIWIIPILLDDRFFHGMLMY